MTTSLINQSKVTMTEDGVLPLPEHIRRMAGLEFGDELIVVWSPPDTILVRKLSEVVADDAAFSQAMQAFDHALQDAGYVTDEDIVKLVREVKAEQAAEWEDEA